MKQGMVSWEDMWSARCTGTDWVLSTTQLHTVQCQECATLTHWSWAELGGWPGPVVTWHRPGHRWSAASRQTLAQVISSPPAACRRAAPRPARDCWWSESWAGAALGTAGSQPPAATQPRPSHYFHCPRRASPRTRHIRAAYWPRTAAATFKLSPPSPTHPCRPRPAELSRVKYVKFLRKLSCRVAWEGRGPGWLGAMM